MQVLLTGQDEKRGEGQKTKKSKISKKLKVTIMSGSIKKPGIILPPLDLRSN
jgi:hypothetical protein